MNSDKIPAANGTRNGQLRFNENRAMLQWRWKQDMKKPVRIARIEKQMPITRRCGCALAQRKDIQAAAVAVSQIKKMTVTEL